MNRQIAEAVRIRRRGGEGAILNSKAEFSRCHIPRLQLEKEEEREAREKREQQLKEQLETELEEGLHQWEQDLVQRKAKELRGKCKTTEGSTRAREPTEGDGARPGKRRKFQLLDDNWGTEGAEGPTLDQTEWAQCLAPPLRSKQTKLRDYFSVDKKVPQSPAGMACMDSDKAPDREDWESAKPLKKSPSISQESKLETEKCEFDTKKMCRVHNCQAKELKIPVSRWEWIKSKNCYGNVRKTSKKLICTRKSSVLVEPVISTQNRIPDAKTQCKLGRGSEEVKSNLSGDYIEIKDRIQRYDERVKPIGDYDGKEPAT